MAEIVEGENALAAERYAQAAFELALEDKALEALEKDFATLSAAFKESADLRTAAVSPLIEPSEKARAFVAVAEKLGLSELGRNLVGVTVRNGRAADLPAIGRAFARLVARHRGSRQVEIISAAPLKPSEREDILAALSGQLGGKVDAVERVDERLIGGFIVRAGSRQFDASVRAKLDSLRLVLKSA